MDNSTYDISCKSVYFQDFVCPEGESSSSFEVKQGDLFTFSTINTTSNYTQYTPFCEVKYTLHKTCQKVYFDCETFELEKGEQLNVKNKHKKFRCIKYKLIQGPSYL